MFTRIGTKGLLIAAALLAGLWLFSKYGGGAGRGTVRSVVVEVDTAELTSVTIRPRRLKGAELEFQRNGGMWTVTDSIGTYTVDKASFDMALSGFQRLRTLRMGGSMAKHASKYELTDSARTSITFRSGDDEPITVNCGLVNTGSARSGRNVRERGRRRPHPRHRGQYHARLGPAYSIVA